MVWSNKNIIITHNYSQYTIIKMFSSTREKGIKNEGSSSPLLLPLATQKENPPSMSTHTCQYTIHVGTK